MKALLLVITLTAFAGIARAEEPCGSLENAFGPFDYRTAPKSAIEVVEKFHFNEDVAALRHGLSAPLGGDIDYTLRAFPNHPRALMAIMSLSEREKRERPIGAGRTVSCYFDRALRWAPNDPTVRTLAGIYFLKHGRKAEAAQQLEAARELSGDSANVNYNLGLAYFELGQYDKALEAAHKAYGAGFQLPGLRNKLERAGKWQPLPAQSSAALTAATPEGKNSASDGKPAVTR